jgi:hypothetical protein
VNEVSRVGLETRGFRPLRRPWLWGEGSKYDRLDRSFGSRGPEFRSARRLTDSFFRAVVIHSLQSYPIPTRLITSLAALKCSNCESWRSTSRGSRQHERTKARNPRVLAQDDSEAFSRHPSFINDVARHPVARRPLRKSGRWVLYEGTLERFDFSASAGTLKSARSFCEIRLDRSKMDAWCEWLVE